MSYIQLNCLKRLMSETITEHQKEEIYSKLLVLNLSDKEARTPHVEGIHKKKAEVANQIGANSCPKCGGVLIRRKGKYGDFKGCDNYPNIGLR